jgi:hypothetical protein
MSGVWLKLILRKQVCHQTMTIGTYFTKFIASKNVVKLKGFINRPVISCWPACIFVIFSSDMIITLVEMCTNLSRSEQWMQSWSKFRKTRSTVPDSTRVMASNGSEKLASKCNDGISEQQNCSISRSAFCLLITIHLNIQLWDFGG